MDELQSREITAFVTMLDSMNKRGGLFFAASFILDGELVHIPSAVITRMIEKDAGFEHEFMKIMRIKDGESRSVKLKAINLFTPSKN